MDVEMMKGILIRAFEKAEEHEKSKRTSKGQD